MEVEMEYRLPPCRLVRLQYGHAGGLHRCFQGLCEARGRAEDRRREGVVQTIDVLDVGFQGNNRVAGVDVPEIHKGQRQVVLLDDARRHLTLDNLTEDALVHVSLPRARPFPNSYVAWSADRKLNVERRISREYTERMSSNKAFFHVQHWGGSLSLCLKATAKAFLPRPPSCWGSPSPSSAFGALRPRGNGRCAPSSRRGR
jgi:hypothetical protein